ncbi:MAG: 5'-methylthioadenosine/S-adenosylhomocysteine nucleosidase [Clostridia bacterium]|nr:5'-methylthioadenosine/S-adenosylhomocysteine nucleosidase [Clostridia bacterium]
MIGLVVAMEKEARLFLENTSIKNEEIISSKKVYLGTYLGHNFVLIISGIGKVNAGISTQIIIDKFNPDYIINFGVAGGKENSRLSSGDMVLVDKACQYDFDLSEIDNVSIGYMQDYSTIYYPTNFEKYKGTQFQIRSCASGDRFTSKPFWLEIIKNLDAQVVDMECGAIAQTCLSNNTPLFILKLISDVDGKDDSIFAQYSNNVKEICNKLPNAIEELITNL